MHNWERKLPQCCSEIVPAKTNLSQMPRRVTRVLKLRGLLHRGSVKAVVRAWTGGKINLGFVGSRNIDPRRLWGWKTLKMMPPIPFLTEEDAEEEI